MMGNTEKLLLSLCLMVASSQGSMSSYSYGHFGVQSAEETNSTWPTKMTFHETKTNYMLGSELLRRLYARIEHTENLFKTEMNQMYEKLRDQIQKNFRKCDRQRRADHASSKNGTNSQKNQGSNNNAANKKQGKQEKKQGKRDKKQNNNNKPDKKSNNDGGWYNPYPYE